MKDDAATGEGMTGDGDKHDATMARLGRWLSIRFPRMVHSLGGRSNWLPDKDSNLNKQSQNLLCYHYTIGQEKYIRRQDDRGAGDRNRTRNRLFTKQVLYR